MTFDPILGAYHRFEPGPRFEIRGELGSGGMGVVYEAYDHERQEVVALKTLRSADERLLARFKREFREIHELAHPNLVALNELFDHGADPFFSMELVRGVDFVRYVRGDAPDAAGASVDPLGHTECQAPSESDTTTSTPSPSASPKGTFDEPRLRATLRQLAKGVAALHSAGKIHRDIKPSNVIVTAQGRVVLLDFGLIAHTSGERSSDGNVVGTVAYMSPEQALGDAASTGSDWYSVGVMLFQALTGALPHRGRTRYELMLRKQKYPAAPPRQYVADVPGDLDQLCVDILQRDPAQRPKVGEIFDRLGVADEPPSSERSVSSSAGVTSATPFVGREEELAALHASFARAGDAARICLVEGVSGVGKSQLVERFLDQLAPENPDLVVLSGRCYEREEVSFKAFDGISDALCTYLRQAPPERVAALMPQRASLLGRMFPTLRRVEAIARARLVRDLPDPHDQRRRMFAALRDLFLRLNRDRRLLWYIDDLQWADPDSMVLLQDLLATPDELPVFLIATARPTEGDSRGAITERLRELAPVDRIQLGELGPADARKLAGLLMPEQDDATLDAVAADARGHPLLLHELACHVADSAEIPAAGIGLDEMLGGRIALLGGGPRRLLQVLAVFGGPIKHEVAALAAELSEAEHIDAARLLRAAKLARTDGVRRGDRLVVYHDRVREHVTARLGADTERHVHTRLALALEQTGEAESAPRAVVRHALAARRRELATTYAIKAAEQATSSLAFDQAAELYAKALAAGEFDVARLRELRIQQANALVNAGRGPEAAALFMTAAEGAEPAVRLDCQRQAAEQWIITGHIERGMDALRASLSEIGVSLASTPRRALARVMWNRVRLRLRGLGFEPRRKAQVAEEELRRLDVLKAVAHGNGMVDNVRGADFNGRFLLSALRSGVRERLVEALATEVLYLTSQGGAAGRRGRRVYARLAELVDELGGEMHARSWMLLADGGASYLEGRFRAAVDALAECEQILREHTTGTTFLRNNTRVLRVHALRQLGAWRENGALIEEGVRSGRQRGDRYLVTTLLFVRGTVFLSRDRAADAVEALERASWSPPDTGFHMQHWAALRTRAEIALYRGRAAAAIDDLAGAYQRLEQSKLLRVQTICAEALSVRGRLLLAAGADGPGRAWVTRAASALEKQDGDYSTVYALLLRAALNRGRPEVAIDLLRRTITLAGACDLALHRAAAQHVLGRLVGGDEGSSLAMHAAEYADQEGIVVPERFFEIFAPGLGA